MMIMGKKRIISVEIATQSKIRLLLDHSQEPTVEKLLNQRAQKQTSKDKEDYSKIKNQHKNAVSRKHLSSNNSQ